MGPTGSRKIEIDVPENLMYALDFYLPLTNFWAGNDYADRALNAFIVEALESYILSEIDEIPLARDHIKDELKRRLEMKS